MIDHLISCLHWLCEFAFTDKSSAMKLPTEVSVLRPSNICVIGTCLLVVLATAMFVWLRPSPEPFGAPAKAEELSRTVFKEGSAFLSRRTQVEGKIVNGNVHNAGEFAAEWASFDKSAALQWIDGLSLSKGMYQTLVGCTIMSWVQKDAEAAAAYALDVAKTMPVDDVMHALVVGWSQTDPEAADAWLTANLEGKVRHAALSSLIIRVLRDDRLELAVLIYEKGTEHLTTKEIENGFGTNREEIARAWGKIDPLAAANWVVSLPESHQKEKAVDVVFHQWGERDPLAAADFANSVLSGTVRDIAIERIVEDMREFQSEAALLLAESIESDEIRKRSLESMAYALRNPPPAADSRESR